MEQELNGVKLVGKAFEVDKLPEEIVSLIGGYKRALIMPIQDKEDKYVTSNGKTLRDLIVEEDIDGADCVYVKALDRCAGMLELAKNELENGGEVNVEYIKWIRQLGELCYAEYPSFMTDTETKEKIEFSLRAYTVGKYDNILDFAYNLGDKEKELANGSCHSTMFEWNIVKEGESYIFKSCRSDNGVRNYVDLSLRYDNYVSICPLDNYFSIIAATNDEYRHSYAASKFELRLDKDEVAGIIVRDMYDNNMPLYLKSEMSIYMMLEYKDGYVRPFDFYTEWFDYPSVID